MIARPKAIKWDFNNMLCSFVFTYRPLVFIGTYLNFLIIYENEDNGLFRRLLL